MRKVQHKTIFTSCG